MVENSNHLGGEKPTRLRDQQMEGKERRIAMVFIFEFDLSNWIVGDSRKPTTGGQQEKRIRRRR